MPSASRSKRVLPPIAKEEKRISSHCHLNVQLFFFFVWRTNVVQFTTQMNVHQSLSQETMLEIALPRHDESASPFFPSPNRFPAVCSITYLCRVDPEVCRDWNRRRISQRSKISVSISHTIGKRWAAKKCWCALLVRARQNALMVCALGRFAFSVNLRVSRARTITLHVQPLQLPLHSLFSYHIQFPS